MHIDEQLDKLQKAEQLIEEVTSSLHGREEDIRALLDADLYITLVCARVANDHFKATITTRRRS